MRKSEAKKLFGEKYVDLARAVGRGKSAISKWPDDLTEDQINLVIGAALRKGIKIPKKFINSRSG